MKITAQEYRSRFCKQKSPQKKDRFRSEWEREFAEWLTAAGYKWKYEAIRLRLADRTTYTPDFYVSQGDGPFYREALQTNDYNPTYRGVFYEVKGFRRQAGMIKFKVAKEQFPEFKFVMVSKDKDGWRFAE